MSAWHEGVVSWPGQCENMRATRLLQDMGHEVGAWRESRGLDEVSPRARGNSPDGRGEQRGKRASRPGCVLEAWRRKSTRQASHIAIPGSTGGGQNNDPLGLVQWRPLASWTGPCFSPLLSLRLSASTQDCPLPTSAGRLAPPLQGSPSPLVPCESYHVPTMPRRLLSCWVQSTPIWR